MKESRWNTPEVGIVYWLMWAVVVVTFVVGRASAIDLPQDARVPNRGPMCCWSSLETLARTHGIEQLYGLRDDRYAQRPNEPAYDSVVKAELDRRQVDYRLTKHFSYDRSLLKQYADSHGVVVAFKAGAGWSSRCHAVVVTHYDDDDVKFYCSDRRTKNGTPHVWTASRAWFDRAWMGGSVVLLRPGEAL